jgi:DNA replication and repair protein RecF
VRLRTLSLTDWRSYESVELSFDDGLTAILGENGEGKTNLIEAIAWLSGIGSFRGVTDDALVRSGAESAVLRAVIQTDDGREQLVEAEIPRVGRNRVQVNRQRVSRLSDLLTVFQVSVFSPDDLTLVKGGPGERRAWLDQALVSHNPRLTALRTEVDRILKQRNALLRGVHGRLDADAELTLEVWDTKLVDAGETLRDARLTLLEQLQPHLSRAYQAVSQQRDNAVAQYQCSWSGSLADALHDSRGLDLRRGLTTVGPHRDEVFLTISENPARTHASQGEQRSLALALRLAVDSVVRETGLISPVLLLDDVFSELDPGRAAALVDALPNTQRFLTTAAGLPPGTEPARVLTVANGQISAMSQQTAGERGDG